MTSVKKITLSTAAVATGAAVALLSSQSIVNPSTAVHFLKIHWPYSTNENDWTNYFGFVGETTSTNLRDWQTNFPALIYSNGAFYFAVTNDGPLVFHRGLFATKQ